MKSKVKLVLGLLGVGLAGLVVGQSADAASCNSLPGPWETQVFCTNGSPGFGNRGSSIGIVQPGADFLCVDSRGQNPETIFADSYGYNSSGVRVTACHATGSGCCGHSCDTTGCDGLAAHDYYAQW
jgi:hypothetical protein